ncbi:MULTISPECIES: SemiSWEET family sugar transporter [Candidatus Nitrosocaldus]|jgi:MtN3 and saliva related transmembrane protein|uniref:Putative MtN3 (Sweet) Family transporter n=1 Tax=Candidatus Nitrosocaldus cavascurensis TaxID=2058097 RepID=A0A2K5AT15_9ARCH|nr:MULTISPECIES: SemiSWEET transporter [Candidatus Nitrosocaldus]SPC34759.1 putative MtN3 (Sweet) Family transporter [Candidatus Nitrosocaldus cavascurensis]
MLIDTMIGMIAAVLTTSSFIPQIFKAYKRKRLDDLSPYLMLLFISGASMWLIYGIFREDAIIVVANVLALAFNSTLLLMKVMYANGKVVKENK